MNRRNLFISNSKKEYLRFALKCFLLIGTFCLFCFGIIMPQYLYGFNASIIDKTHRAESIEEPKIILAGNSNMVFGINSELIQEATGMPVVNMGIHAGLGNAFLDNMIKPYVSEGDIVIVCHTEYADDDEILNEQLAWITVENHLGLWRAFRLKDIYPMVKAYPTYLKGCIDLWIKGEGNKKSGEAYSREYFNIYGDNIFAREEQQMQFVEGQIRVPEINDTCINRLNELNAYVTDKSASMVIAAYPVVGCEYTPDKAEYAAFQGKLQSLLDSVIISDFTDYIIDEKYFFDSAFHLTDAGVEIRTNKLIKDIEYYINNND